MSQWDQLTEAELIKLIDAIGDNGKNTGSPRGVELLRQLRDSVPDRLKDVHHELGVYLNRREDEHTT